MEEQEEEEEYKESNKSQLVWDDDEVHLTHNTHIFDNVFRPLFFRFYSRSSDGDSSVNDSLVVMMIRLIPPYFFLIIVIVTPHQLSSPSYYAMTIIIKQAALTSPLPIYIYTLPLAGIQLSSLFDSFRSFQCTK